MENCVYHDQISDYVKNMHLRETEVRYFFLPEILNNFFQLKQKRN